MLLILLLFQFVLQKAGIHTSKAKVEGICQKKLITYLEKCNNTLPAYMPVSTEVLTLVQHRCDDIGVV